MRRVSILLACLATLLGACDTSADDEPPEPTTSLSPTTTANPTTSLSPSTTAAPSTTTAPNTSTGLDGEPLEPALRCESPEGYVISYPEGWVANPGDVVPACGQFHTDEFEVPEGTDERVAAITAYIDPVPFAEVAAPDETRNAQRAVTAVDGLQAVRLEFEAPDDALWPEGTPVTLYAIDVGTSEMERTLFVDTVGISGFDYQQNRGVLDRMVRSLDVEMEGVEDDPNVVARYEGGGGGFSVEGTVDGDRACLRVLPQGGEVCTDLPAPDQLHTVLLENLEPVLAGVTGEEVHAVTIQRTDGTDVTALPVQIGDSDVRGFSFTFDLGQVERFVLTDVDGEELRTIEPGG